MPPTTPDLQALRSVPAADLSELRAAVAGAVVTPDDDAYDVARQAWAAAVDQRPVAVVVPVDEADVAATVRFAAENGLRVAPQGTGHNAKPLGSLAGTILLKTSAMLGVEIDAERRIARVQAGVIWEQVTDAAAEHGLAPLAGSSPNVGVVGYSLGGGMGWLSRKHGLQANAITAVEIVTSDGALRRVDADHDPELFWALRGGNGNYGVVTALEFRLYPIAEVYAGMLAWDWKDARKVLQAWREWTQVVPDEVTTSARIMQFPPIEEIPEFLRGRQLVVIDGAILADDEYTSACLLQPLRDLEPEIDMWGTMPAAGLVRVHGDPEDPTPAESDSRVLGELTEEAVDAFVDAAGPGSGSPLLMAELRHVGGALGRIPADHGALPIVDGAYVLFALGVAFTPEMGQVSLAGARSLTNVMEPWSNGRRYLNFVENPTDPRFGFGQLTYRRLQAVRRRVDPRGVMHSNHQIDS
jgi:UDP-N-acetylenolpyruvoylglucosamine reductase